MTIATMKQALDAQEYLLKDLRNRDSIHLMGQGALDRLKESNDALRAAIEQAEKTEPVATKLPTQAFSCFHVSAEDFGKLKALPDGTALYAHPAPVPAGWQPSNEELTAIYVKANGIEGKSPPITTERIFTAMRAMLAAAPKPGEMK